MNRSCSQSSNLGLGASPQGRPGQSCEASRVKIGGLWKRSQGVSRFTKTNYKHRVFILTEQALSYYQGTIDRIGQLKGRVVLDTVRAVEFVQDNAFNLAHTFQVVYQSKKHGFVTLYVTATDNNHCAEWVASLRQACYFNRDMLMHFHPGALIKNKWSCCGQRGKTTLGCQPTYHLLTRSSSRYAQMRRRDTLTSNNSGSQKRRRNQSCPYSTIDRQSLTACSQASAQDIDGASQSKPGQGLSNSCMNLTSVAPHRAESFVTDDGRLSQRSSRVSTDHSVGVDSITLTRVSVIETTPTGFDGECDLSGSEPCVAQIQQQGSCKRNSRSQVAPELEASLPVKQFSSSSSSCSHPLEVEHKSLTLPNPKSKSHRRAQRYLNSIDSAHETSPPRPTPPPRHRRHHLATANSALTGSVHVIPTAKTNHEPPSLSQDDQRCDVSVESGRLKHSHTFVVHCRTEAVCRAIEQQQLKSRPKNCSQSMNALTKPVIEPKFSLTNPNIVHV